MRLRLRGDALRPAGPRSDKLRAGQDGLTFVQFPLQLLNLVLPVRQPPLQVSYPLLLEQQDLGKVVVHVEMRVKVCRDSPRYGRNSKVPVPLAGLRRRTRIPPPPTPTPTHPPPLNARRMMMMLREHFSLPTCLFQEEIAKRRLEAGNARLMEPRHASPPSRAEPSLPGAAADPSLRSQLHKRFLSEDAGRS